jgi:hypothetical protein
MSDWTKQTEELVTTWNETQKKMWDNWLQAMESAGSGTNLRAFEKERQKIVDTWETSVMKGLEAQAEWAKLWSDGLAANKSTPKPMLDWAKQLGDMMRSWTASQEQLSQVWFDMMKKLDTTEMQGAWESHGKEMVKAWQDAVDKALEAQREMGKFWAESAKR